MKMWKVVLHILYSICTLFTLQAWYTVGVFYFQQEEFNEALYSFEKAKTCHAVRIMLCSYIL